MGVYVSGAPYSRSRRSLSGCLFRRFPSGQFRPYLRPSTDRYLGHAARRELLGIDRQVQREIISYLDERIAENADPRAFGKPLVGDLAGLWRYRVRDYRIICDINKDTLRILIVRIAHRRHVDDV